MTARGRQAVPRGAPCGYCGKPIRTAVRPMGHTRKYCDRLRCRRARVNRVSLASYHRLGAYGAQRQRELYDPEKRHARAQAMTPAQLERSRAYGRRYRRTHRDDIRAKRRARYDPAARRARYLATGT